jgi:hypothetical protein
MDKALAYRRDVDRRHVHWREPANRLETRQRLVRHQILRRQEAAIRAAIRGPFLWWTYQLVMNYY